MHRLITVSGPTCSGKQTLINATKALQAPFIEPVSYTTREPREGEVDGVHYHFVTRERFAQMIQDGEFIEYAPVHKNFYGTTREVMLGALEQGDVLYDLDVNGAMQLKKKLPTQAIFVYAPPDSLEKRIRERGKDTEEQIQIRMKTARGEIAQVQSFDWVIINADHGLETATTEFNTLVTELREGGTPNLLRFRNPAVVRGILASIKQN